MRPNLGYYVQTINDIVQDTEKIGETMNPDYEVIRQAIDENKLQELTSEQIAQTLTTFREGTDKYQAMLEKITRLRPPAKVLGIHKKFERSYQKYVAGCEEMIASLQGETIDVTSFDASEKKQDDATDEISFAIQRMTKLLLGR